MSLILGLGLAVVRLVSWAVTLLRLLRARRPLLEVPTVLPRGVAGDSVDLSFSLPWRGPMGFSYGGLELMSGDRTARGHLETEAPGHAGTASRTVVFRVSLVLRGYYHLRAVSLHKLDPLGLSGLVLTTMIPADTPPLSLPPVLRIAAAEGPTEAPPEIEGHGEGAPRDLLSLQRNDDLIESRRYHPGDDVRRINWSAYARTGELHVKIGEEQPPPGLARHLDLDCRGLETPELVDILAATALAVSRALATGGTPPTCRVLTDARASSVCGSDELPWLLSAVITAGDSPGRTALHPGVVTAVPMDGHDPELKDRGRMLLGLHRNGGRRVIALQQEGNEDEQILAHLD